MGFFNLFKKTKRKEEIKKQTVNLEEFHNIIQKNKEENKKREVEIHEEIKKILSNIEEELIIKNESLKQIDLDSKKERERIKSIVKENLSNYIIYVERLIKKIKSIQFL